MMWVNEFGALIALACMAWLVERRIWTIGWLGYFALAANAFGFGLNMEVLISHM